MRLNKFLSDRGVCSRREADRLVEDGLVLVDGVVAVMGQKVDDSMKIMVKGVPVNSKSDKVIIALNKPVGVECTTDSTNPDNIVDFVGYPQRIYPIGRLDKNSQGIILLTNDGSIVNKILKGSNFKEKEYIVTVDKPITDDFIQKMSDGVEILDTVTRPCKVTKMGRHTFDIILTQGLNRQIRRMCKKLGYRVQKLKRIRILNIELGNLPIGKYRELTEEEINKLNSLIQ
ncbi:MAG: pseudouridine synthase [Lachnospiraceae bacterium]|nr:pseudouridine synthase [Lachnospiraceae bacterium]